MRPTFTPAGGLLGALPLLRIETAEALVHVRLNRPAKRNAINDALIAQLHTAFVNLPADARAVIVSGEGPHFCAGPARRSGPRPPPRSSRNCTRPSLTGLPMRAR